MRSRISILSAALAVASGCHDAPTDTSRRTAAAPLPDAQADAQLATLSWYHLGERFALATFASPIPRNRVFAYLTLAQYRAAAAADDAYGGAWPSYVAAAVAGASAEVLTYFFPAEAALIAERLSEAEQAAAVNVHSGFAAGAEFGRAVGAPVIARARTDRFDLPWTGHVPAGEGFWFSSANPPAPPAFPRLGEMRAFYLTSNDQFRPPTPPAYGSPEFQAALAELRQISDTRTAEQKHIAEFWATGPGGQVYWNGTAVDLIGRYGITSERDAAHVLALLHTAMVDANIASHEAKFTYWLIRPSQADPAIVPIGLPNFPSYPSNHAAISGTASLVLAALFPGDADWLVAAGEEAGTSRMYGGIHYRFDRDAGFELAHKIADLALTMDRQGALLGALP